jgi:tRNA A37 threonylcarbamoyltransferase TsaD
LSAWRPRRRSRRRGGCRWRPSTTSRATWRRPTWSRSRWSRRSCACWRPAATRCSRGWRSRGRTRCSGRTLDDAAGEAFDKGARLLGLPYPGGPALSKLALEGDPEAFAFPRAERVAGLDFSFAGLKTALLYATRDLGEEETTRRAADLAASYEAAIVDALILRVERALAAEPGARLALGGGVAANRLLRERATGLGSS